MHHRKALNRSEGNVCSRFRRAVVSPDAGMKAAADSMNRPGQHGIFVFFHQHRDGSDAYEHHRQDQQVVEGGQHHDFHLLSAAWGSKSLAIQDFLVESQGFGGDILPAASAVQAVAGSLPALLDLSWIIHEALQL